MTSGAITHGQVEGQAGGAEGAPEIPSDRPFRPKLLVAGIIVFLTLGLGGLIVWLANRSAFCYNPSFGPFPGGGVPPCNVVEDWAVAGFAAFVGGLAIAIGLVYSSVRRPADVTPVMPRVARTQITVELAPVTKRALEEIVSAGESLSVQDFVRRAVDEKLDRWKKEHPLGVSTARGR